MTTPSRATEGAQGLSAERSLGGGNRQGAVIVDDLVDTADRPAGARHDARRAFRHRLRQPKGRPLVDTFITEVSQDTWIFLFRGIRRSRSSRRSATARRD